MQMQKSIRIGIMLEDRADCVMFKIIINMYFFNSLEIKI